MSKPNSILLALDRSPILQSIEQSLLAVGYLTVSVHDRAALEKTFQESSPALMIISEVFDGEKSNSIITELLDRFPTLPIIFTATENSPTSMREILQLGVSSYLLPPLRTEEIVMAIESSLKRAKQMGDWVRQEVRQNTVSLEKRVNEFEVLVALGREITELQALDEVLNSVVSAAVKLTNAEEGSLLLLEEESGKLYMRAGHNFEKGFAETFRLPVQDTLAGQVIESGESIVMNKSSLHKIQTAYLVQSLIYVPIRQPGRVFGVLGVDNRLKKASFTERDTLLLTILADYAAVAIENARLYQISEAERSKFEAVFANMDDALVIIDDNETIQLINKSMCAAFGLQISEVTNKAILEAITHSDLHNLLSRKNSGSLRYHEINFDDGRVFNAQYTVIPRVGAAITMQDISYLKELDRLKDDFVHTVSHDLRSPLTAVLGYAELLERIGTLNDQQKEFVRRIQSSVQDITSLVNDLLDLGRIESGFDSRHEDVQLDSILRYTLDTLSQQSAQKKQILDVEIAPDLPALRGNPIRLRQMLDNLIGNAIKYTPVGKRVSVKLNLGGDQIILQVSDNGAGIPKGEQPHIFDKFYRASNVPSDSSGSGLGLAIVKTIIESHQGRIWVESAENQGSTFFVVLPANQTE